MSEPLFCGIDEVGRGCLAGPLISVAAVFRGKDTGCPDVDDSKKMSEKRREKAFPQILRSPLLVGFGVGEVSVGEINQFGIDWANAESFCRALRVLFCPLPNFIYVDGVNGVKGWPENLQQVEPKSDGKYPVVSAASVLAKVIRDNYMKELALQFPQYAWESNKGYGSQAHRDAIKEHGATMHHRTKFVSKMI